MFVTKLVHYPIVLGIPWMELHNVAIRFSSRTLTFGSEYYTAHCNTVPTVAHAITSKPTELTLCSLVLKVAPCGPAGSAGAGENRTQLFMSPHPMSNPTKADQFPQARSHPDARDVWPDVQHDVRPTRPS